MKLSLISLPTLAELTVLGDGLQQHAYKQQRHVASFRSLGSPFSPALNSKYCQINKLAFLEIKLSMCMLKKQRANHKYQAN